MATAMMELSDDNDAHNADWIFYTYITVDCISFIMREENLFINT